MRRPTLLLAGLSLLLGACVSQLPGASKGQTAGSIQAHNDLLASSQAW